MEGPEHYDVIIHNDDSTPFSAVIQILVELFDYTRDDAVALAEKVHNDGSAVAGSYIFEIAETKISEVDHVNEMNGLSLKVTLNGDEESESLEITEDLIDDIIEQLKRHNKDSDS